MSRHVMDVGRRGLRPTISTPLSTAILSTIRPRTPTTFITSSPASYYHSTSQPLALFARSATARSQHAASTNTPFGRPRSAAPDLRSLVTKRAFHPPSRSSDDWTQGATRWLVKRRWNSSSKRTTDVRVADEAHKQSGSSTAESSHPGKAHTGAPSGSEGGRSIYDRLPHLHRPTKAELLAAATGFWHRLQIRFKWFSIRSVRPFNHDEIFAFLSWIFWGHILWLLIGTTTFVSLILVAANTVSAQETLASFIGNYLTRSSGLKVVFEQAIVPKWSNGMIQFNKVFVSRRPAADKSQRSVTKGSSATAAAAAATAAQIQGEGQQIGTPADDGNYTQFDVTIEKVEVSLSFAKWFNGKGLLRDVSIEGVRGVLDRTNVKPRKEDADRDPKSYRHEHNPGDFEIEDFQMKDVILTVHQPNNFRPFQVMVGDCRLPRLRKQWLFYDFLCANSAQGTFDGSMFSLSHRSVHSTTGVPLIDGREDGPSQWKKHSTLRIKELNIDHLNRGVEGPFSWIHEGNVDIAADIMIPHDVDGSIAKVMSDFYDRVEATVTQQANTAQIKASQQVINNKEESLEALHNQQQNPEPVREEDNRFIVFDIRIHLNQVRASVPIFTRDLSYVNNAVVRPIVAYINSHAHGNSNYIPINCRIVKQLSEFDGSWTVFDCGLLGDLSRETYDAFVRDISDRKQQQRRIKKVGLWAASVAAQALFIGLAGQLA